MTENELSRVVFDCALKVHRTLGPGLLESAYEECLSYELLNANIFVERQKVLLIVYESIKLDAGYRLDLMIERKVIIELKAVETLTDVHLAQVMTYLRLSGCRLGLLINFNVTLLKNGMRRVVNNL